MRIPLRFRVVIGPKLRHVGVSAIARKSGSLGSSGGISRKSGSASGRRGPNGVNRRVRSYSQYIEILTGGHDARGHSARLAFYGAASLLKHLNDFTIGLGRWRWGRSGSAAEDGYRFGRAGVFRYGPPRAQSGLATGTFAPGSGCAGADGDRILRKAD